MRAKSVQNFQRGLEPKKSLGLGPFYSIPLNTMEPKYVMKELGFKWDREMVEENTNSEGDDEVWDVWVNDGVELATQSADWIDPGEEMFFWNLTTGLTFDAECSDHDEILKTVKDNLYE